MVRYFGPMSIFEDVGDFAVNAWDFAVDHTLDAINDPAGHFYRVALEKPISELTNPDNWARVAAFYIGAYLGAVFGVAEGLVNIIQLLGPTVVNGDKATTKALLTEYMWRVDMYNKWLSLQALGEQLSQTPAQVQAKVDQIDAQTKKFADEITKALQDPDFQKYVQDALMQCVGSEEQVRECLAQLNRSPEALALEYCRANFPNSACRPDQMAIATNVLAKRQIYNVNVEYNVYEGTRRQDPLFFGPAPSADEARERYLDALKKLGPGSVQTMKFRQDYILKLRTRVSDLNLPLSERIRASYQQLQLEAFPQSAFSNTWPPDFQRQAQAFRESFANVRRQELQDAAARVSAPTTLQGLRILPSDNKGFLAQLLWAGALTAPAWIPWLASRKGWIR